MRILLLTAASLLLLSQAAFAAENQKLYRWVDKDGTVHYGDSIPAEYAEVEKQVVNEHGVTLDVLRGKKTDEEIAAYLQGQKEMVEKVNTDIKNVLAKAGEYQ